ncbi:MAG: hypothetical protein MI810_14305 [Flavobacteriales bacterium]|nr:hypothetical protein [Flavobacteriales bacterium]
MDIHIFSTNVQKVKDALNLTNLLRLYFRLRDVNFDLGDFRQGEEMILRIESENLQPVRIVQAMNDLGYECKPL